MVDFTQNIYNFYKHLNYSIDNGFDQWDNLIQL